MVVDMWRVVGLVWVPLGVACRPAPEPVDSQPTETAPPPDTGASDSEAPHTGEPADSGDTGDSAPPIPPELPPLRINELLASNGFTLELPISRRPDLVELYNAGDVDISLAGYSLTDDLDAPGKHPLGATLVVPARGWLLLYADGRTDDGPTHLGFSLDNGGGALGLFTTDGWPVDTLTYGDQVADWSAARVPDGATTWKTGLLPTPGLSNGAGETNPDTAGGHHEEVPDADDLSEDFYDHGAIVYAELELSYSALRSLRRDPDTWVEGSFHYDGRTYGPIGVRTKGENSFLPIDRKASLKLSFDKFVSGGRFLGLEEITFNNMSNDISMMHERVAYYMYRHAGVPSARANHAWLKLNGEDYGLFANVETVDENLIARWFTDPEGTLFEVHDVDFADEYVDSFTLEYGEDDRTNLQGVADAMEVASGARAIALVGEHLSVDSYLDYWAVSAVVGQFDSYPYGVPGDDCHVYDDPVTGVLHFLPHGVDETFYSPSNDITGVYGVLSEQCLDSALCSREWETRVWEMQELAESIGLVDFALQVSLQIAEHVAADPGRPYDQDDVLEYQDGMLVFIEERAAALEAQIGARP